MWEGKVSGLLFFEQAGSGESYAHVCDLLLGVVMFLLWFAIRGWRFVVGGLSSRARVVGGRVFEFVIVVGSVQKLQ